MCRSLQRAVRKRSVTRNIATFSDGPQFRLGELVMSDAEYYLAQAEFCLESSRTVPHSDRVRWLTLAGEWADMAETAEITSDPALA